MGLIEKLLGLLSEGLGLDPNYIQILNKEPLLQLRINYYPPCPQPDMVNGLKPHSDEDMLTVLLDDGVDGLQVRKDEEWFTVPSIPGALIVNIGDLLQASEILCVLFGISIVCLIWLDFSRVIVK